MSAANPTAVLSLNRPIGVVVGIVILLVNGAP
jgi:hypothetical protein